MEWGETLRTTIARELEEEAGKVSLLHSAQSREELWRRGDEHGLLHGDRGARHGLHPRRGAVVGDGRRPDVPGEVGADRRRRTAAALVRLPSTCFNTERI